MNNLTRFGIFFTINQVWAFRRMRIYLPYLPFISHQIKSVHFDRTFLLSLYGTSALTFPRTWCNCENCQNIQNTPNHAWYNGTRTAQTSGHRYWGNNKMPSLNAWFIFVQLMHTRIIIIIIIIAVLLLWSLYPFCFLFPWQCFINFFVSLEPPPFHFMHEWSGISVGVQQYDIIAGWHC